MLTDIQIEDLAKRMSIPLEGCFFKDELPKKINFNKVYIINLQDSITDDGSENQGTHWTLLYIRKTPKEQLQPIYFDPYGCPPPENVKLIVEQNTKLRCPYTEKDIQSLMNNACGFYCLALAHFICSSKYRTNDLYTDVEEFLNIFDDLNTSVDWKKNEYLLKLFFQSSSGKGNNSIDVFNQTHADYERIISEDSGKGKDLMKIPININSHK